MLLFSMNFLAILQVQGPSLPAEWRNLAAELHKLTGWTYQCPDFSGTVPGPGLKPNNRGSSAFQWADQLATRLNRGVSVDEGTKVITLVPLGRGGQWCAAHSAGFRLIAKGGTRESNFQQPERGPDRYLRLELGWENDLEPLLVPSVWNGIYVRSEAGREKKWVGAGGLREPGTNREYSVHLSGLDESLKQGWSIRLTGKAIVPTAIRALDLGEWPKVRESIQKKPEGVGKEGSFSCWLVGASQNGLRVSLRVRVEKDSGGPELESYQSWVVLNKLWMTDRLGEVARPVGQVLEKEDGKVAEVTYHLVFPEGTEKRPRVIHYRTLTGIREVDLDFDLKGLPALP